MDKNSIDLDIIQPCYNPLPDWEQSVWCHFQSVQKLLPDLSINLIIVNDGSIKHVQQSQIDFLKQRIPDFQYVHYPFNHGKGYALRKGVEQCKGNIQIYTDIDFPFELKHVKEMYNLLNSNEADIVVGIRNSKYYQRLSPQRFLASRASQLLNSVFLKLPINDTQSGIKGFNNKGRYLFLKTTIDRYLVDAEFLALATKTKKLKIVPIEVSLRDDIVLSPMGIRTFLGELKNFAKVYSTHFRAT